GETARPRRYTGSRPLALDRRRPPALDLSLARVRGGDRGPALVRGPPALHRSAAARLRHCHPAALVGPGLEVAGILHARARADPVPALLPGRRGVGALLPAPVRVRLLRAAGGAALHRLSPPCSGPRVAAQAALGRARRRAVDALAPEQPAGAPAIGRLAAADDAVLGTARNFA